MAYGIRTRSGRYTRSGVRYGRSRPTPRMRARNGRRGGRRGRTL